MTDERTAEILNEKQYRGRSNWEPERHGEFVQFKTPGIPGERLYLSEIEATNVANGFVAERENLKLRRMLALQCAPLVLLYTDDGELQDNSEMPWIDYLRDSPEEIDRKRMERFSKMLMGESR